MKSITIICRGEALRKINPSTNLTVTSGNQPKYKLDGDQREILKRGYAAAEEILKQKNVTVATLGICELIAGIQFVLGRPQYHITAVANTEMLVMDMELNDCSD